MHFQACLTNAQNTLTQGTHFSAWMSKMVLPQCSFLGMGLRVMRHAMLKLIHSHMKCSSKGIIQVGTRRIRQIGSVWLIEKRSITLFAWNNNSIISGLILSSNGIRIFNWIMRRNNWIWLRLWRCLRQSSLVVIYSNMRMLKAILSTIKILYDFAIKKRDNYSNFIINFNMNLQIKKRIQLN